MEAGGAASPAGEALAGARAAPCWAPWTPGAPLWGLPSCPSDSDRGRSFQRCSRRLVKLGGRKSRILAMMPWMCRDGSWAAESWRFAQMLAGGWSRRIAAERETWTSESPGLHFTGFTRCAHAACELQVPALPHLSPEWPGQFCQIAGLILPRVHFATRVGLGQSAKQPLLHWASFRSHPGGSLFLDRSDEMIVLERGWKG